MEKLFLAQRRLVSPEFMLDFGRHDGGFRLRDEIFPDSRRWRDAQASSHVDADRFGSDLGAVYHQQSRRISA